MGHSLNKIYKTVHVDLPIPLPQFLIAEFVGTFVFFFIILTVTNKKTQPSSDTFVVFALVATGLLTGRYVGSESGAALNPAVALSFSFYSAVF